MEQSEIGGEGRTIYLSGPMRGIPQFNFPAFYEAQANFEAEHWTVFNPADGGWGGGDPETGTGVTDDEVRAWLREDIQWIARADAVALLPGWEDSEGAQFEVAIAHRLGLDFFEADTMARVVLEEQ